MKKKYYILCLVFSFFWFSGYTQDKVKKQDIPYWIKLVSYNRLIKDKTTEGAFSYLLTNWQKNLDKETSFTHFAIKINNNEGVQEMSDLDFSYDPSYEELKIHFINVIRDGEVIDKVSDAKVQTIQKEESSKRLLYDGSLTTIFNLKDIRKNDILEYAFSTVGFNPISKGHFSRAAYLEYTMPIQHISHRIISKQNLKFKTYSGASNPKITETKHGKEYALNSKNTQGVVYEKNTPGWYNIQKRVVFSTFNNWEEVVEWALPNYNFKAQLTPLEFENATTIEDKIVETIRFVQDEIRYLGFEDGISAYKPHSPKKIYDQRYGDCKDKSLLLVTLLKNIGIKAYPVLVNTEAKQTLKDKLPTYNVFDHCIILIEYKNKKYFIDPTISNQGGDLKHHENPNYYYGLVVKKGEHKLTSIPFSSKHTLTKILETFNIDSIGGGCTMIAKTKYYGGRANNIRSYFKTNSYSDIQREYVDYYKSLYPEILSKDEIIFTDKKRNSTNEIEIIEKYEIPKFWTKDEDSNQFNCVTAPLSIEDIISYSESPKRKMPYYLGEPFSLSQTTKLVLPESWDTSEDSNIINSASFNYAYDVKKEGNTILINHNYRLKKEFIPSKEVSTFFEKHDSINAKVRHELFYTDNTSNSKISWLSITLALITLVISCFFMMKIYTNFNPNPIENPEQLNIGGWLILPAIGITLFPILTLYTIINEQFFLTSTWNSFDIYDNKQGILLFVGLELIYNIIFITYNILVVVCFYKKRSSLPILVTILYFVSLLIPVMDGLVTNILIPEINASIFDKDFFKTLISSLIWIPLF